jgi:hypothetical protein
MGRAWRGSGRQRARAFGLRRQVNCFSVPLTPRLKPLSQVWPRRGADRCVRAGALGRRRWCFRVNAIPLLLQMTICS